MVLAYIKTQCLQHKHTPNTKDNLLLQPITDTIAIQVVSNLSIFIIVFIQVGIQQDDWLLSIHVTLENIQPATNPYWPTFDIDRNLGIQWCSPKSRVPEFRLLDLVTVTIDRLFEITGPTYQTDSHHGQFQVGGWAHSVTGKNTQTSAVSGYLIDQRYFHGEIGSAGF